MSCGFCDDGDSTRVGYDREGERKEGVGEVDVFAKGKIHSSKITCLEITICPVCKFRHLYPRCEVL